MVMAVNNRPSGVLMGLDIGLKRIGVASCDPTGILASPWTTVIRKSRLQDFQTFARLVNERQVKALVVGLPFNMDGSEGFQARSVSRYAQALADYLSLPIIMWDERLSTSTAHEKRNEPNRGRLHQGVDAWAAAIILQDYLNQNHLGGQQT
jgi:putative holliday junction resolvase